MKKIYRYIIAFIILATVVFSILYILRSNITQKEKEAYDNYISEGIKERERKEYGKALSSFAKASETIPQRVESYSHIVDLLVVKNRFDDAGDVVQQSTKVLSNADRALLNRQLAQHYFLDNQINGTEKYYLEADKLKSTDEGYLGLAKVYLKLNDSNKAKKVIDRVKANEGSLALEKDLLRAYILKLNFKEAKEILDRWDLALEEDSEVVVKVKDYLATLNQLGSDDLYNRAILSREYINSGYPILAIEILESEVEKMGEYPDGLFFLARAYFDSGKYSTSLDLLNKVLSFDEYTSESYILLARINVINGDQNVAFENYEKALSNSSKEEKLDVYREYVGILLSEKSFSTMKEVLDEIVQDKVEAGIWPALMYLEMYYEQKNYAQMSAMLTTLSKLSTLTDLEMADYLRWQITYDIENDQLAKAKEGLTQLRSLDRFNPYFYLLSGRVNLIENNLERAKDDLNMAINYDLKGSVTDSAKKLLGRIE